MNQIPLTSAGAERLRQELKQLKSVKRPQIIEAIATARDHGDLKENAEYHAAREEQSFVEGRIAELESALSNAQIIDITRIPQQDRVVFGCTVELILYLCTNNNSVNKKLVKFLCRPIVLATIPTIDRVVPRFRPWDWA